ncbi:hypothetical protein BDA99DRAFT_161168 [Phascolomyces articulosus]|uniref:ERCC4 domain-containing protein n=1 Tax=Phascolomyces articulosus TaxID=60185 RepID=A0AAD5PB27_9FUNG|nr:hypothetical protein BDA99DRAFT_161168 [Phascolomyces articulosus]
MLKRDRAKEEKKAEKERKKLLEHANRLRVNRNELLSEMILDVRPEFACSPRGQLLKQVVTEKEAEFHASDTGLHTITWRRRCMAQWDEEKGVFLPYPDQKPRIIKESYVLLFMDMPQLCALISSQDMNSQIDRIQSRAGEDAKIILMTEGLETYYKKKNVLVQRDFNKVVLENLSQQQEQTSNGSSTPSKKRTTTGSSKSNDPIVEAARTGPRKVEMEEKLTYLQMMKNIRLVPTVDLADTVDWIVALTADIANAMYKHRNFKYFKHQGPAKSGVDAADSWSKMLQEIQLCTPAVADAVISKYPNLSSLHRAYQCVGLDDRDKEKLLAELEVERSVISSRDRTVNKHMSKKIYTIFSSTDDQLNIA